VRSGDRGGHFCVGLHEKHGVYTQEGHRDELLRRFFGAARRVNDAAVLLEVTLSVVE